MSTQRREVCVVGVDCYLIKKMKCPGSAGGLGGWGGAGRQRAVTIKQGATSRQTDEANVFWQQRLGRRKDPNQVRSAGSRPLWSADPGSFYTALSHSQRLSVATTPSKTQGKANHTRWNNQLSLRFFLPPFLFFFPIRPQHAPSSPGSSTQPRVFAPLVRPACTCLIVFWISGFTSQVRSDVPLPPLHSFGMVASFEQWVYPRAFWPSALWSRCCKARTFIFKKNALNCSGSFQNKAHLEK